MAGSLGGMAIALIVWLATAKGLFGEITIDTLSDQWVSFAGNAAAIVSGGVLSIGLSLWRPANFDWEKTRNMSTVHESVGTIDESSEKGDEKGDLEGEGKSISRESGNAQENDGLDFVALQRTFKIYGLLFAALALIITIVCFSARIEPSRSPDIPSICPDHSGTIGCLAIYLLKTFPRCCRGSHVCEYKLPYRFLQVSLIADPLTQDLAIRRLVLGRVFANHRVSESSMADYSSTRG